MARYHINPETGNPNKCSAQAGNCPFKSEAGDEATHYSSKNEARAGYEQKMESQGNRPQELKPIVDTEISPTKADGTRNPKFFTKDELTEINAMEVDGDGFVRLREVSNGFLGEQTQYISRYFSGVNEKFPVLVEGLSYSGRPNDYHSYKLAKSDVPEFIARLRAYRASVFQDCR